MSSSVLPIFLPYGYVAVYGLGTDSGISGLTTGDTIFRFATIYQVGVNMGTSMIGNSIVFNSEDTVCRLAWDNYPYPVIPTNKIIGTENLP